MSNSQELAIGKKMRDKVTGFTGIAVLRSEFLTGNTQYSLAPEGVDGGPGADEKGFDQHQLEVVDDGLEAIEAVEETGIELGNKVEDIVTGIVGIATQKVTFLNGCVYYMVVPRAEKSNKEAPSSFFEYQRLKVKSDGVVDAIEKKPAGLRASGGPSFSIPKRS